MKTKLNLLATLLLTIALTGFSQGTPEKMVISGTWKFQKGDHSEYANPKFDDSAWKSIPVDKIWEESGYANYDGIGWYRIKVVIPSSLRNARPSETAFRIALGIIDDSDISYLNGKKIGENSGYMTQRAYSVPSELINWDKENVIAVRVTDTGGGGGMWGGEYSISFPQLTDKVALIDEDKPVEFTQANSQFTKKLKFKFKTPVDKLSGNLSLKVFHAKTNLVVYQNEQKLDIGSKADSSYTLKLSIKEPGFYKVSSKFYTSNYQDTLRSNTLLTYKTEIRANERPVLPVIDLKVPYQTNQFNLENIGFDEYMGDRLDANLNERILKIDETGILECYYNRPGNQTWAGEYTGKYLHAASRVWRNTQNAQLKTQMDRIVDILLSCQNSDGYLGTYSPQDYWTAWDVWAHKYNILGLLSYYAVTGYQPALEASIKMGDLLCRTFGENPGQRSILKDSPHVGMASTSVLEPMTELYRFTGNKKYLDFCFYILKAYEYADGPKIISTLNTLGKVDKTANGKAYEMMSNLTGIVKLYQLTGDATLLKAAENAWKDVSAYKLYITGTASKAEMFQEDHVLPASNEVHMGEGCVTTTWIQFSQALYYVTGEAKYIDEIEKAIYNHLFAAENPQTGCVSYYTALQGVKPYRCTIYGHCCLASIPRGIAAIPELVFTKNETNGCNINIYSAGEFSDNLKTADGQSIPVKLTLNTTFPETGNVDISISVAKPATFNVALRVPEWCKNFVAKVDGSEYKGSPGQYLNLNKSWKKESKIQISMDLNVQELDGGKSYPGYSAIKIGPRVLAFDQKLNPEVSDLDKLQIENAKIKALSKSSLPNDWFGTEVYSLNAMYNNQPKSIKLVPYAEAGQTGSEVRVWLKKQQ